MRTAAEVDRVVIRDRVRVELGARSYDVHVGTDATAALVAELAGGGRIAVLADERVAALHGSTLEERLRAAGVPVTGHVLPAGESAKTLEVVETTCRELVAAGIERGDVVLGFGGGAATDVAGFVAAIALRGLAWAALPTSLLGQVDASVGGKTGVNLPEGKNLVGAFHQPLGVACDPAYLATLPPRELRAGLAEVVKTAWIGDPALFERLEADPPATADHPDLPDTVRRCVAVKAAVVAEDERESGRREVLNFGHTLGHAIETEAGGRWLHGEAVSLGMVAAVQLSVETGRCEPALLDRLVALLRRLELPVSDPSLDPQRLIARTRRDKKRRRARDRWQLTRGLGAVSVADDVMESAVQAAVGYLRG